MNDDEGTDEGRADDPGFIGGGGVARTAEGKDEETLDEHGDNLSRVEEDDS
jgi:hypothetical protein